MKTIFIIFLFCTVLTGFLMAEEVSVIDKYPHFIGFHAGYLSDVSLVAGKYFGASGYKLGLMLSYNSDLNLPNNALLGYTISGTYHHSLNRFDLTRWLSTHLYVLGGIDHFAYYYEYEAASGNPGDLNYIPGITARFTPGVSLAGGIGFELVLCEHISIPMEMVFIGAYTFDSTNEAAANLNFKTFPQGGIQYRY